MSKVKIKVNNINIKISKMSCYKGRLAPSIYTTTNFETAVQLLISTSNAIISSNKEVNGQIKVIDIIDSLIISIDKGGLL